MIEDGGEDIRAGDGWKREPAPLTRAQRVRGQIRSMRAESMAQGATHFEPFFRDVEELCDLDEAEQQQQDRIDKANEKAEDDA